MLKRRQGCSTACVPGMRRRQGGRARTSFTASIRRYKARKGTDPWDPLDLSQCLSVHPCPHPCPGRLCSRKVLHFQEGPSLQSGAGQRCVWLRGA